MSREVTPLPKAKDRKGRKEPSAASLKKKATVLHSKVVRGRAGRCERCGRNDGRLECAHIVSRRYCATRTDENGAWCLCSGCHMFLTQNPFEHVLFATLTLGDHGYEALRRKAYDGVNGKYPASYWRAEIERLEQKLAGEA